MSLPNPMPRALVDFVANALQQAVPHVVHQAISASRLFLVLAGRQVALGAAGYVARFLADVGVLAGQPCADKTNARKALWVGGRNCPCKQHFQFVANRQEDFLCL